MELNVDLWSPSTRRVEVDRNRVRVWLTEETDSLTVLLGDETDHLIDWLKDTYERVKTAQRAQLRRERADIEPPLVGFPCEGSAMPDRRGDAA